MLRKLVEYIFIMIYAPPITMGDLWPLFVAWAFIIFGAGFLVGKLF